MPFISPIAPLRTLAAPVTAYEYEAEGNLQRSTNEYNALGRVQRVVGNN